MGIAFVPSSTSCRTARGVFVWDWFPVSVFTMTNTYGKVMGLHRLERLPLNAHRLVSQGKLSPPDYPNCECPRPPVYLDHLHRRRIGAVAQHRSNDEYGVDGYQVQAVLLRYPPCLLLSHDLRRHRRTS